jgi:branched-chain amino acid transport system substrate-binding protein
MKRLLLGIGVLLCSFLSVDHGYSQPALKVGALVPVMGRLGETGRECAKGLLDGGRWINQKGGIYGRRLEILLVEDTSQPAETIAAFRKLNEADRSILLYVYSAETALVIHPHIQFNRIPTVVSFLPSDLANPSKFSYLFTVTPTVLDSAKIGIQFISEKSGVKSRNPKLAFVGNSVSPDRPFLDEARTFAKKNGIDLTPDVWVSTQDISSALAAVLSSQPDFAYLSLTPRESFLLLQEAKRIGLRARWVGSPKAFDETLASIDGVWGIQPVAPFGEDVPGMAAVREAHQKWHPFDSHTLSYVEGWAASQVIAETLGRSLPEQKLSREKVKASFESLRNFVTGGLLPPITITPADHRPSVESRILAVRDQKLERYTTFISLGR